MLLSKPCWFTALSIALGCCVAASAAQVVTTPFLGVRLIHQTETSPRPLNIYVVEIDLSAPGLSFQMSPGGPHPRPLGSTGLPMETIRQTTRQFANAVGAEIAINGSFYSTACSGCSHWANNLGLTASGGEKYSPWELPSSPDFDDALNITQQNQATIVEMAASLPTGFETNPVVPVYNAVTGSHRLIQNGSNVAPASCGFCGVNPRTAVGTTANNQLLLMTVDGRQSGFSEGVTLIELANLMIGHGATNAINLDGGGSTTMVMNDYGDGLAAQVLNSPSDGGERSVGTNLAVFASRSGDYNGDGVVDAADYVVWRDIGADQSGYEAWRANFGAAGDGIGATLPVPEPSAMLLAALAICLFARRGLKLAAK
ncbi:MAG: phosphodiester glycosidase family protein [Pirellulales bacterium]